MTYCIKDMSSYILTVQYSHNDANLHSKFRCVFALYVWFRKAAKECKYLKVNPSFVTVRRYILYVCVLDMLYSVH